MYLKSLTIRGFKSFADKTTLELEPGVTVVVGPNGSGKSNVVDSVAWVLGAQGARALRGAKMDDVIFAGAANRPALGRAEVSLTIDNASGTLPIEFSEVTITRTLFRTGESEYQINGTPCRLLDIQELLSDSGIGRQQHVIIGQGQLDSVLNARPEDRRAIIEEAAGILKFRKRREKAERRLETTEGNLLRLTDLVREVRRQLRPLERQADAARRHDGLVAEVGAIRLHLAGRELGGLQRRLERQHAARAELGGVEAEIRARLRALDAAVVEAEAAASGPADDLLAEMLLRVEGLRERGKGLRALVAERGRGLERELAAAADEGVVETLVADAGALRAELAEVDRDFASLAPRRDEVEAAERRVEELRRSLAAEPSRVEERRAAEHAVREAEVVARDADGEASRWREQGEALRAELALVRDEQTTVGAARQELAPLELEVLAAERDVLARRDALEVDGDEERGPEAAAQRAAEAELRAAEARWRAAEAEGGRWQARAETLAVALDEARAAVGGEAVADLDGVLGPLVDHLSIEPGAEEAVAAALGDAVRALVVDDGPAARAAVARCKAGDAAALLLVADPAAPVPLPAPAPAGTRPLLDVVRATDPAVGLALRRLLTGVVLAGSWEHAVDVAGERRGVVVVTRDGDRFGGDGAWRAGGPTRSAVTAAAVADASERASRAEEARAAAEREVVEARARLDAARDTERARARALAARRSELERAQADAARRRRELDVQRAALDERLGLLDRRAGDLSERLVSHPVGLEARDRAVFEAGAALDAARAALDAARAAEQAASERVRARRAELERLRTAAAALRRDHEVRGAGIEERRAVLTRRLEAVEERLARRPDEQAAAQRRRAALEGRRAALDDLDSRLAVRLEAVDELGARLRRRRQAESEAAREAGRRLDALRADRSGAERELAESRERAGRVEVEEAETRLRIEQSVETIRRDFDCEPERALEAPPPEVPEGSTLAGRARELERELRLLGPVNPLALTEYEALLERHEFLQAQLDDVKGTRRELARVIRAVDAEIVSVFEQAFADVARNFEALFGTLFPGGSGRVVLTDPSNLLDTGVEIEARPSGKNVRRLSLLSGGERSLTALAYLFAVFRARPSPFYLMDEVEAALDDVNLHRFLELVEEFRREAQLVIVSHQKRTMEAADVLYGVSMPPGGSSRVVAQRMRDLALEDASAGR